MKSIILFASIVAALSSLSRKKENDNAIPTILKGHVQDSFVSIPPNHFHLRIKELIEELVSIREQHTVLNHSSFEENVSLRNTALQAEAL